MAAVSTPEDDAALNAKAAALEGQFIGAGEGPASGGGAADAPPSGPTTGELLTAMLIPTFRVMVPNWNVQDAECAMLGEAYGAVIDKYFPDFDFGVEFTAVVATLAIFGPRWRTPPRHPKPEATDAAA